MTGPVMAHLGEKKLELGPAENAPREGDWRYATDEDGIAWLVLDVEGSGTNTISGRVLEGLNRHLEALAAAPPKALVIRSAKPAGFAAGADIGEFETLIEEGAVDARLREGHGVLDRLAALPFPTVAVVHGAALGAGFELALACDRRILVEGGSFGFPEVQLGLHPGLGGTVRLTRLIDPLEAMTLMLTGKTAHTRKARRLGIADAVVAERHVRNAVRGAADGKLDGPDRLLKFRALDLAPARRMAARRMRAEAAKKAPVEHYPAPHALIDIWERHGDDSVAMQKAEIESFARLLTTDTATNLRHVFGLRQRLKAAARGEARIGHVHVVGAGAMGADIAAWAAVKGHRVTLEDLDTGPLGTAVARTVKVAKGAHLSDREVRDTLDRLMPDPKGYGAARADLVIEAVPEDVDLKHRIYAGLEERMKPEAILATNTSSLPLADLAEGVRNRARFAGLHFFNPVPKMVLVEVVSHPGAEAATLDRLAAFCGALGKLPARVSDYPGFLVNRMLTPYLLEAAVMVEEGAQPADIDAAAEAFGMPVGPVELSDRVGLDICLAVAHSLTDRLDKPLAEPPARLRDLVEAGHTGQKAGRGFYAWADGKPDKGAAGNGPTPEMTDRLILPMLDAGVECLRREVVADAETLDGAMIFGTGFAPFRGGPMRHADTRGRAEIRARLEDLAAAHGPRFAPDPGWSTP